MADALDKIIAKRQRKKADFTEGPVRKLFNAGVTAYENMRGLNIGGAESGRRARAEAIRRKNGRRA